MEQGWSKDGGQDGAKDGGDDGAVAGSSAPSPSPPHPLRPPSPPTFPLHAASVAALGEGSALLAARKVAEALAAVELRQRALSTRVAARRPRLAEGVGRHQGAVQSAHSTEWSELVWRATGDTRGQGRGAAGASTTIATTGSSALATVAAAQAGAVQAAAAARAVAGQAGVPPGRRRGRYRRRPGGLCGGGVVARCLLS